MHHSGSQPAIIRRQDGLGQVLGFPEPEAVTETPPDCELFAGRLFEGDHIRVSIPMPQFGIAWEHTIASVIVHHGVWRFYRRADFQQSHPVDLGPGHHADVRSLWGGRECGSFEPVSW